MRPLVLITGGTNRLGYFIAESFAKKGYDLALHFHSNPDNAEKAMKAIGAYGVECACFRANFAELNQAESLMAKVLSHFKKTPDILINNSGVFHWDDIETISAQALEEHFKINIFAATLLSRDYNQACQKEQRNGVIINILDQKLMNLHGDHLSYTLSKYALMGLTYTLAKELVPLIRVCGIAPGYTLPGPCEAEEEFSKKHDKTPLNRGVQPLEIAETALYIAQNQSLTGQIITVDAGSHLGSKQRDFAFM